MARVTSTRPRRGQTATRKYLGVGRRRNGKLYFNKRFCCGPIKTKLFTNDLKSEKEGAVLHDLLKLFEFYIKVRNGDTDGERTDVGLKLNFPDISRSLLPELLELSPESLTEDEFKSKLMKIVILQARKAIKTNQEIQSAGTQGANSRSVHFETAAVTPSPASRGSVSPLPVCGSEEIQISEDKLFEANETVTPNHWDLSSAARAPIKISHGLDNPISEHSECNQLQKEVEDANFDFIDDSLTNSGDERTGRLREEEPGLITPIFELPETVFWISTPFDCEIC